MIIKRMDFYSSKKKNKKKIHKNIKITKSEKLMSS